MGTSTGTEADTGRQDRARPARSFLSPRTTPGLLRLAAVGLVVALAVLAVVEAWALRTRRDAARAVGLQAAPLLVEAQDLYVALAAVDATASRAFLTAGGAEPPELRRQYLDRLDAAARHLATIAGTPGAAGEMHEAAQAIVQQLPVYAGLVDSARANDRLGFPLGAAYLRQASTLMRETMLPEAERLYDGASQRIDDAGSSGTSAWHLVVVSASAAAVLLAFVATQLFVGVRCRRVLNLGLLAATVLVVAMAGLLVARLVASQDGLVRAQRDGSDLVQVLSAVRILSLRAQSDAGSALIERGTGDIYLEDFERVVERLDGPSGGLLDAAVALAERSSSAPGVAALPGAFASFRAAHDGVRLLDEDGRYTEAVSRFLTDELDAADHFGDRVQTEIDAARVSFDADARAARNGFVAPAAATALCVVAGLLAVTGLQRRLAEYR